MKKVRLFLPFIGDLILNLSQSFSQGYLLKPEANRHSLAYAACPDHIMPERLTL